MFNHLCLQGKFTYVTFIHHVFSGPRKKVYVFQFLYQSVVGIWKEISQLALILVKILVTHWQICGLQSKFQFLCPSCQSNLFLVTWFMVAIWEISPLAPILCSKFMVSCVAKWEIFYYFSYCLAHWLSKLWHFGKF